ncbi:sigma-54 dependent transcriptional regulator [uncultured Desulfuromonas sp.]|uniref:sigma-54-dependent transcriptional regulator n=1 Tax=uncultured Desulfuromonas sp. TaxID=181013 RepID=UPI002AAB8E95|nr:sigma-54 dependent transcriptional regulator [uncultured Desulfuromonas sp.]
MATINILIIDDETDVCNFFRRLLKYKGYEVTTATNEPQATQALEDNNFQVALVDLKLPDTDGLTLLSLIKSRQPDCEVIIMTGYSTIKTAVSAMQQGAYEYVEKPFEEISEIEELVDRAVAYGTSRQQGNQSEEEWADVADSVGFKVGNSLAMRRTVSLAYKIAKKNINVLIQGKTGTGKEVMARFIHAASNRADQSFIAVNCGALPENLLDSELFGHEKGAFTGGHRTRRGIFELANHGTLLLDEIGDASPLIQVKLLRVLETGEFMRVGGETPIKTNVRVIAATNVDLERAIDEKTFREDLYYRLNVVKVEIPSLEERREDISQLAEFFVKQLNPNLTLAPATLERLNGYSWPGNIRELANCMRRAIVLCNDDVIQPSHLGERLGCRNEESGLPTGLDNVPQSPENPPQSLENFWEKYGNEEALEAMSPGELHQMWHSLRGLEKTLTSIMARKNMLPPSHQGLKDSEKETIQEALEQHRWNITETAKSLGIARNTLHRKIKKYNLRFKES